MSLITFLFQYFISIYSFKATDAVPINAVKALQEQLKNAHPKKVISQFVNFFLNKKI